MKTQIVSKTTLLAAAVALVSGLGVTPVSAMQNFQGSESAPLESLRVSRQIGEIARDTSPQNSVFSEEMLSLRIEANQSAVNTALIPGEFSEIEAEYDGFNYTIN